MITIPPRSTKKIVQNNRSNILGDIWSSMNLDLTSNVGAIRLSPRLRINTVNEANQGLCVAFKVFDSRVFTISGTRIFKNSATDLTTGFTEDSSTGFQTTYSSDISDLEVFNSTLCATTNTKVMSKDADGSGAGAWTNRATIQTSTNHKIMLFPKTNRVYYFDAFAKIKSMDTSWSEATSGSYFMDQTAGYPYGLFYTMDFDDSNIWIGTIRPIANNSTDTFRGASILKWDGITGSQITTEYKIKASGVLAMCKDDKGTMHAMDSTGALLYFNGANFQEYDLGKLPLNREFLINSNAINYNAFIHPNGLKYSGNGKFTALINNLVGDSSGSIKENMPSGLWEFTKETGWIHKQSFSYNTLLNATVTDYGQNRVSRVGALVDTSLYSASASGKPTLICSATYYTDASATNNAIFVDDPLNTVQKNGYFVSSWVLSQNLRDMWQTLCVRFKQLLDSGDKIVTKYRIRETVSIEPTITWASTSSFTTTTDVSGKEGYEVEVTQGTGGGKTAHISTITDNGGGTWTVTLDDTFTGVTSGTAKARIQNWKKVSVTTNQAIESVADAIGTPSSRVQIKCTMQFTGDDEIQELVLINQAETKLE